MEQLLGCGVILLVYIRSRFFRRISHGCSVRSSKIRYCDVASTMRRVEFVCKYVRVGFCRGSASTNSARKTVGIAISVVTLIGPTTLPNGPV